MATGELTNVQGVWSHIHLMETASARLRFVFFGRCGFWLVQTVFCQSRQDFSHGDYHSILMSNPLGNLIFRGLSRRIGIPPAFPSRICTLPSACILNDPFPALRRRGSARFSGKTYSEMTTPDRQKRGLYCANSPEEHGFGDGCLSGLRPSGAQRIGEASFFTRAGQPVPQAG